MLTPKNAASTSSLKIHETWARVFHQIWKDFGPIVRLLDRHEIFRPMKTKNANFKFFLPSLLEIASHAGVFRGARISSLPTNACSTENNIPLVSFSPNSEYSVHCITLAKERQEGKR